MNLLRVEKSASRTIKLVGLDRESTRGRVLDLGKFDTPRLHTCKCLSLKFILKNGVLCFMWSALCHCLPRYIRYLGSLQVASLGI